MRAIIAVGFFAVGILAPFESLIARAQSNPTPPTICPRRARGSGDRSTYQLRVDPVQ